MDFKKKKYDIDQILGHFGLKAGLDCAALNQWLDVVVPMDFEFSPLLERQQKRMQKEVATWNEEELKMRFLSFVFAEADLEVPEKAILFYERPMTAVIQGDTLTVVCDALLASPYGINTPQKPYFFLQEFKKSKNIGNDAEGQMLLGMLIAQTLNAEQKPIYGCYLQGKHWTFTTLSEKQYCFSQAYDATKPHDLAQILHVLRKLKTIVGID